MMVLNEKQAELFQGAGDVYKIAHAYFIIDFFALTNNHVLFIGKPNV